MVAVRIGAETRTTVVEFAMTIRVVKPARDRVAATDQVAVADQVVVTDSEHHLTEIQVVDVVAVKPLGAKRKDG